MVVYAPVYPLRYCELCGVSLDRGYTDRCGLHVHTRSEPAIPVSTAETKIQALQSQITTLSEQIERIKALPVEPDFDTNVIYFEKTYGRTAAAPYAYAAVRTNGNYWFVTGRRNQPPSYSRSWSQLLDFIYEDEQPNAIPEIWVATYYERVQ